MYTCSCALKCFLFTKHKIAHLLQLIKCDHSFEFPHVAISTHFQAQETGHSLIPQQSLVHHSTSQPKHYLLSIMTVDVYKGCCARENRDRFVLLDKADNMTTIFRGSELGGICIGVELQNRTIVDRNKRDLEKHVQ